MLSLSGITKHFGRLRALANVTVDFAPGEIHAVLGENGAGKSTLMHVLAGLLRPDAGTISLDRHPLRLESPQAARRVGIGMVHQHLTLVEPLTVAENLVLSFPSVPRLRLSAAKAAHQAVALARQLGLDIGDPNAITGNLPVGTRQRIEIVKALAGDARILILDEPTAVLTREETRQLFVMLRLLRDGGRLILFITHKLREVMEIADRVTVMRNGKVVATRSIAGLTEGALATLMIGTPVPPRRPRPIIADDAPERLRVEALSTAGNGGRALRRVSFTIRSGEIFGVAGVSGNGQEELFESLVGIRPLTKGSVLMDGQQLTDARPAARAAAGLGHIPPDRHRDGLVLAMSVAENAALNPGVLSRLRNGIFLPRRAVLRFATDLVSSHSVRTDSLDALAATLSGGNQQRLIIARQLAPQPSVVVAVNPTRGLDIAATRDVYDALNVFAAAGRALLLISNDLDEVLDLCHRFAVLFEGSLSAALTPPVAPEVIGRLMSGAAS